MLRGIALFTCDKCKKVFFGLKFEYNCTCLPAPVKCPKCGSWHTMPLSPSMLFVGKDMYKRIWKEHDKRYPENDNSLTHVSAFIPGGGYLGNLMEKCRALNEEIDKTPSLLEGAPEEVASKIWALERHLSERIKDTEKLEKARQEQEKKNEELKGNENGKGNGNENENENGADNANAK